MTLPLVSNITPGGVFGAMKNGNAFAKELFETELARLKNQFEPLEAAVKAQNSIAYGSKAGSAATFLRTFAELPVAERQAFLGNPENRAIVQNLLSGYGQGVTNPNSPYSQNNLITPELLSAVGLSSPGQSNALTGGYNPPPNVNTFNQPTYQPVNTNPMNEVPVDNTNNVRMPKPVNPSAPTGNTKQAIENQYGNIGEVVPEEGTGYNHADEARDKAQSQAKKVNSDYTPPPPILDADDKAITYSQYLANRAGSDKIANNRAAGAVTFEKWLLENRDKYAKALADYATYSGLYGKGKKMLDQWKHDQPESFANYMFVKNSFDPSSGNQIKFMEHMGATNTQLEEAKKILVAMDEATISPKTLANIINKNIGGMLDLGESIFETAEPRYSGVYRKLYQLPSLKVPYINPKLLDTKTPTATVKYKGKTYNKIGGKWYPA